LGWFKKGKFRRIRERKEDEIRSFKEE